MASLLPKHLFTKRVRRRYLGGAAVVTVEERVSHLEAKVDELGKTTTEIKSMLATLDQKIDKRFDALEDRIEVRFGAVEARFGAMEARFTGMEGRFTAVETRFNQWFLSILGLQVMTLLAIVAGLFGILTKLI